VPSGPFPPAPFQTVRAGFPHTAYRWSSRLQRAQVRVTRRATYPVQAVAASQSFNPPDAWQSAELAAPSHRIRAGGY